ncbi:Crp/Fnr family transcriptional regulator [Chondrinema litorale]|uniref:Crp/Fnr family transcriptional regulator n=1 Tax=Chondrinema litorale TaxID=2994555 RepID=UPI0025434DB6|nr:Crp/Fnr family transcriptional regulator [Chondrinema litorale]UZR96970.1 Crp/Fnr family transcriptional regulator [Chondrinema litorale]
MNSKDQIKNIFSQMVKMSEDEWLYFSERLVHKKYKKKEIITGFNQLENKLCYLVDGIVRHIVDPLNETTIAFTFPGNFFSNYDSFISRKTGIIEIRAITPIVECYYISYNSLQEVYENTSCGDRIGRLAAEQQYLKKSSREISFLTLSPKEKYLQLMDEQPHLLESIPLKYLASYMGITPETLSRVRASIS